MKSVPRPNPSLSVVVMPQPGGEGQAEVIPVIRRAQTVICFSHDEQAEPSYARWLALTVITSGWAATQRSIGPA